MELFGRPDLRDANDHHWIGGRKLLLSGWLGERVWVANKWKLVKLDLITFSSRFFFPQRSEAWFWEKGLAQLLFSSADTPRPRRRFVFDTFGKYFPRFFEEGRCLRHISNLNSYHFSLFIYERKWLNLVIDRFVRWFGPAKVVYSVLCFEIRALEREEDESWGVVIQRVSLARAWCGWFEVDWILGQRWCELLVAKWWNIYRGCWLRV